MPKLDWTQRESVRADLRKSRSPTADQVRIPAGPRRRRYAARVNEAGGIADGAYARLLVTDPIIEAKHLFYLKMRAV